MKDNFPLPNIELILHQVVGSSIMSLLDGFSGYNQIYVKKSDKHKTTFTTKWGTFAFHHMHFGPTNVEATFKRDISISFDDLIGKII